jgi:hypothetical protein
MTTTQASSRKWRLDVTDGLTSHHASRQITFDRAAKAAAATGTAVTISRWENGSWTQVARIEPQEG